MLSTLIFNWMGYRLLIGFMESKADQALERKIANSDYDESSLIEIKVSLSSPYITDFFGEFDRYVGELELDGIHYKFVKRKIVNGDLILFCLPNKEKNQLQNSREEFFKLVNDLNQSRKQDKSHATSFKSIAIEYHEQVNSWTVAEFAPFISKHSPFSSCLVDLGYGNVPERPPKV
ncbi:MAG: hypothetical protein JNK79_05750 [Chitinophagaceae bacterium]|nr:hypothetical protein [Chitinophagaceae bacterium]